MKSKLFRLNWKDVATGLLIAFLTAFLTGIIELLQKGIFPDWSAIKAALIAGICAALAYLIKSFATNSQDKLLAREPSEIN